MVAVLVFSALRHNICFAGVCSVIKANGRSERAAPCLGSHEAVLFRRELTRI